jgi:hypothetical protein
MNEILKGTLFLIAYLLGQSVLLALFATIIWNGLLINTFTISIGYWQWFGILFIVNLLRFDIVEKSNNFMTMIERNEKNRSDENEIQ